MKMKIDKSVIHGTGLIAIKNIKKDEVIFIIKGNPVNFLICDEEKAELAGLNWIGIGKNKWVDPVNGGGYINHSCNPNSGLKGKLSVVALKDIYKGDEITFDYSLSEADIFWEMECKCKSDNCRSNIYSIQFLSEDLFLKNSNYIPTYYKNVYKKFRVINFKNRNELKLAWVNFISKDFYKIKHLKYVKVV